MDIFGLLPQGLDLLPMCGLSFCVMRDGSAEEIAVVTDDVSDHKTGITSSHQVN
jgi:hypothetical protein